MNLPWLHYLYREITMILLSNLVGSLSKCRQFKISLKKILDNYQNVDISKICPDSLKFRRLWKCRHLVIKKYHNVDILKILVKNNSLHLMESVYLAQRGCTDFRPIFQKLKNRIPKPFWGFSGTRNSMLPKSKSKIVRF